MVETLGPRRRRRAAAPRPAERWRRARARARGSACARASPPVVALVRERPDAARLPHDRRRRDRRSSPPRFAHAAEPAHARHRGPHRPRQDPLVEALTGTNTDRLPEERARGISIELGYAPLDLPSGRRLSVIDVPGHERFVRTMVAGATGIDLFLLVVDAGEGPRPQTHEHLQILPPARRRARRRRADQDRRGRAGADRRDRRRCATSLPGAEIVPVSAVTGERARRAARRARPRGRGRPRFDAAPDARGSYVDRVFSLPGAGTVVTGTLWSGTIGAGDRLEVLPGGLRGSRPQRPGARRDGRARRRRPARRARARRRAAASPRAGDALVAPGAFPVSYRLDVALDGDVARRRARARSATGPRPCPHGSFDRGGYAQLRLDQPLVAARGDRVVLRRRDDASAAASCSTRRRRGTPIPTGLVAPREEPVRVRELRRCGVSTPSGLQQAGDWAFSPEWLDELRVEYAPCWPRARASPTPACRRAR